MTKRAKMKPSLTVENFEPDIIAPSKVITGSDPEIDKLSDSLPKKSSFPRQNNLI